jgi:hypothetical protein
LVESKATEEIFLWAYEVNEGKKTDSVVIVGQALPRKCNKVHGRISSLNTKFDAKIGVQSTCMKLKGCF